MKGLKTGMYYLRTKPAAQAIQFTVDKSKLKKQTDAKLENGTSAPNGVDKKDDAFNMSSMVCSIENKDDCMMCGS
ncbi:hypothetical protein LSTR_LSTR008853 [Laodelphax striatellus]|uniref:Uncharacterized protein n=1 Tax=Laodelphax striatellus TaxID=195883 RepID=A0A482WSR7_LAOST|nr:hypothetical protein LSTR_LSTR008853 [Laodelphax striatellus]